MGIKTYLQFVKTYYKQEKKKEDTPVAVIEWGTTGKQRVVTGTLSTIVSIVKNENISNPSMTIVGDVVSLRIKSLERTQAIARQESFICICNE